jgi:hypothetical protein
MKVEQRYEGHGGAVVPAVQGGPQRGDPSASASTLHLPAHPWEMFNNPYSSGQNNPELYLI